MLYFTNSLGLEIGVRCSVLLKYFPYTQMQPNRKKRYLGKYTHLQYNDFQLRHNDLVNIGVEFIYLIVSVFVCKLVRIVMGSKISLVRSQVVKYLLQSVYIGR